jgi:predicted outer membrane lipoprotein
MTEVLSRVPAADSDGLVAGFVLLSLVLAGASIGFAIAIFLELGALILGVLLAAAFAALGGMVLAYHRLSHDHRIVREHGEELW